MSILETIRAYAAGATTPPIIPQGGGSYVTPKVTSTGTVGPGLSERMAAVDGRNAYGGINYTEATAARIENINCELQPKAFLGATMDYYC